jgi:hypothetical protein
LTDADNNAGSSNAIAIVGSTVYLGGSFEKVAGQLRNSVAAISTDGTLQPWNPGVAFAWSDVSAIATNGSTILLGGSFDWLTGRRINLAAVGTDGTLSDWGTL